VRFNCLERWPGDAASLHELCSRVKPTNQIGVGLRMQAIYGNIGHGILLGLHGFATLLNILNGCVYMKYET